MPCKTLISAASLLAAVALTAAAAAPASASVFFNGVTPDPAGARFNYSVTSVADDCQSGDFFTIFDFALPIASTATQPAGWAYSSSLTGPVPSSLSGASFNDDPLVSNITWTYTGPTTTQMPGDFSIVSAAAGLGQTIFVQRSGGGDSAIASITTAAVPEPATLGVLGVASLSLLARRRRA